ncbi:cryptochrome/photolyase family protein [Pseudochryseolinea flava]|uniref:Deoxyribodipyrimidine photo-lyase n=1 Tax=Pseudochryseolinea flava TaxID=2059302 RepID=A0A364XWN5_9BACT|nr:deoxyribodipyrimidine photo-lyase [Pseudochryseolinea flava]RAV98624.1 deoxyribodipyrimidine photo-lyase [Pseudochryseolinea flava]
MWSNEQLFEIIKPEDTIFWFRRDLRLDDNAGLYRALHGNSKVVPIFIFDSVILNELEDKNDRRVDFIYQSLLQLKSQLEELGSSLLIFYGDPIKLYDRLHAKAVYTNHDFEPYAIKRDDQVKALLMKKNIAFHHFKDHVIFEKDEVIKDDGKPYTIFTPYSKKWKAKLNKFFLKSYPTEKYFNNFKKFKKVNTPSLQDIGFGKSDAYFPPRVISQAIIQNYHKTRDYPAIKGTTRLSVHLRFGTVSIRKLAQIALKKNEVWLNELIWRDFYAMILFHFPHVVNKAFKPAYDQIRWRNNEKEFEKWCDGKTGYPIVDAGMRELNATGFMHNRVRMITASFLVKHLLIDWRWGEAYFARQLLDYDLASNNGGWQWAASSGCDAAPYFRVFNPELQTDKFDADHKYIKQWVPEWGTPKYPAPVVDHKIARERVLETYKKALND